MLKVLNLIWPTSVLCIFIFLVLVIVNRDLGLIAFPILVAANVYLISKDWGAYLILMGKFDQAISFFSQKINSDPANAGHYNNRGTAHFAKGNHQAAIHDFKKALQVDPKHAVAYENLGSEYAQMDDLETALANFERALVVDPRSASVYSNRGTVFLRQHKLEEALADFKLSIHLNPKNAISYCRCGTIFFLSQDFVTALRCYKDAHKLDSSLPEPHAGIAITLHAMGKLPQAKRTWKAVVKKSSYYLKPEWLKNELKWAEPLVEEAQKLMAE